MTFVSFTKYVRVPVSSPAGALLVQYASLNSTRLFRYGIIMAELCHFPVDLVARTRELQDIVRDKFLPSLRFRRTEQENNLLIANSLLQSLLLLKDSTLDDTGYKTYLNSIKESLSEGNKTAILRLLRDYDSQASRLNGPPSYMKHALDEELKSGDCIEEANLKIPEIEVSVFIKLNEQDDVSLHDLLQSERRNSNVQAHTTDADDVGLDCSPDLDLDPSIFLPQKRDAVGLDSSVLNKRPRD